MSGTGYVNVGGNFKIFPEFVYRKDILIDCSIVTKLPSDNYGNTPYRVRIKLNNLLVNKFTFSDASIPIKPKVTPNGISLGIFFDSFENTFLGLIHDIQLSMRDAVKTYNSTVPECDRIKEYYGDFDFDSIKWKKYAVKYEKDKGKPLEKFDRGIDLAVYFTRNGRYFKLPVRYVPDVNNMANYTMLTDTSDSLDRATVTRIYKRNKEDLISGGMDLVKRVYGKTLEELEKLSDAELSKFGLLIDDKSYENVLDKKQAILLSFTITDLKDTSKSDYLSWKFALSYLVVTDRQGNAAMAQDEGDDEFAQLVQNAQAKSNAAKIIVADDDFDVDV